MRNTLGILGLVAAMACAVNGTLAAQPQPAGIITGRVFDIVTEEAIVGAVVRVQGQALTVQSDADGRFALRDVTPGIVQLDVRRVGYTPTIKSDIAVSAGKPVVVAIGMSKATVQLQAVTVRPPAFPAQTSASLPVSSIALSAEELRRTPGALEDVVQAVSIAPGVASTTGGRNDLFVRGGASYENLFIVDNIEVPNINHFGTQGTSGGPLSLINIRFIDNATLSTGGFGVRYGDRVSSVTNLTLREGNRERLAGEVNLAASQYGAILEGPLGKDASFLFNVRRSYLDLLFKALGVAFIPTYTDATFKATWRPNRRNIVSLLAVGALDAVNFNNDKADDRVKNSQILGTTQDQYFSGLTWKRLFASGVVTTTMGRTWTRYRTSQFDSLTPPNPIFTANSTEGENSLRSDLTWQLHPSLELDVGNIAKYADRLRYDVRLPGFARFDNAGVPRPLRVDTTFAAFRNATYAQAAWQASSMLRLTAGVRGDYYKFLRDRFVIAPRASASLALDPVTTTTLSVGRYYQAPSFIWLTGDASNATALQPLRADQVVLGLQRLVGSEWRWQVEGYAKRYANYPARVYRPNAVLQPAGFDDVTADIPFGLEPLEASGTGRVWGTEFLVQKKLGVVPIYGLASVSLSRSSFTGINGTTTRGAFDSPVIVNVVGGWRPNPRWELSGRLRTSTGLPTTPFLTTGASAGTVDFARYNSQRLPFFLAIDGRVDRRWSFRGSQLITFVDVQNLNARANVSGYQWNPRTRVVEKSAGLAVFPTIGVNWEF